MLSIACSCAISMVCGCVIGFLCAIVEVVNVILYGCGSAASMDVFCLQFMFVWLLYVQNWLEISCWIKAGN